MRARKALSILYNPPTWLHAKVTVWQLDSSLLQGLVSNASWACNMDPPVWAIDSRLPFRAWWGGQYAPSARADNRQTGPDDLPAFGRQTGELAKTPL
jgi:hypothetical protein